MSKTITTISFFILALIMGAFVLLPEVRNYQSINKGLRVLEGVEKELADLEVVHSELKKKVDSVSKADLDQSDKALPRGPEKEGFLRLLEFLVVKNSVAMKGIELAEVQGAVSSVASLPRPGGAESVVAIEEPPKILSFSLAVFGTYGAFKNLLGDLEKSLRIIDVETISFGPFDGESQSLDFRLKGKTYYQ